MISMKRIFVGSSSFSRYIYSTDVSCQLHRTILTRRTRQNHHQIREISLLHRIILPTPNNNVNNNNASNNNAITKEQFRLDLERAIGLVRRYDPSGYLPGLLLPTVEARIGYYAVRSFWVETGLKFENLPEESMSNISTTEEEQMKRSFSERPSAPPTPAERVRWWQKGIQSVFHQSSSDSPNEEEESSISSSSSSSVDLWKTHPSLRLIHHVHSTLSKSHFDSILAARMEDANLSQYPTIQSFIDHARTSCGSLHSLVLQASNVDSSTIPSAYTAALDAGICHGIANSLRMSIPIASQTGRIIIPADLCIKHGVKSPRYLLSALGQGDAHCRQALAQSVKDLTFLARDHLRSSRTRRHAILEEIMSSNSDDVQKKAVEAAIMSSLLPVVASEKFLNRLERTNFDLTDRNLRNIGWAEHFACTRTVMQAWWNQTY